MVKTLRQLLTQETLQNLTSATTCARGVAYAAEGRVLSLTATTTQLIAVVQGCQRYDVRVWVRGGELAFSCTCPFAAEGACCKHSVAVATQWLASEAKTGDNETVG